MLSNNPPTTLTNEIDYRGYKIRVTEYYTFHYSGPDLPESTAKSSLAEAKRAIDDEIKNTTRQRSISKNLKLKVRDKDGNLLTFRGFHSRTGEPLSTPQAFKYQGFYPDVPWVVEMLQKRVELHRQISALNSELKDVEHRNHVYGPISAERYQETLNKWLKEFEYKVNIAKKKEVPEPKMPHAFGGITKIEPLSD